MHAHCHGRFGQGVRDVSRRPGRHFENGGGLILKIKIKKKIYDEMVTKNYCKAGGGKKVYIRGYIGEFH